MNEIEKTQLINDILAPLLNINIANLTIGALTVSTQAVVNKVFEAENKGLIVFKKPDNTGN
jgi:hypothetical protein